MESMYKDGLYTENGYRIRCMRGLLEQVENDYAELGRLWDRIEKRDLDGLEEEEMVRVLAWLGQGLRIYKELRNRGLEGIRCVEIEEIEKDVKKKASRIAPLWQVPPIRKEPCRSPFF